MSLIEIRQLKVDPALRVLLHALHDSFGKDTSDTQSVRGGTQINLRDRVQLPFAEEISEYIRDSWELEGMWSIRLQKGGYHVQHNHPKGRVSGCFYVDIPDPRTGRLILDGRELPVSDGMLVMFPSAMPHGTTVYAGTEPRLTMAFDVVVQ
jgi:hypothetical protein